MKVVTARQRCGWVEVDADGLRRLQEDYPLAVRELAEQSAVSHNTITVIENRHRNVNLSVVRKLAAALGVESRKLIREGASSVRRSGRVTRGEGGGAIRGTLVLPAGHGLSAKDRTLRDAWLRCCRLSDAQKFVY